MMTMPGGGGGGGPPPPADPKLLAAQAIFAILEGGAKVDPKEVSELRNAFDTGVLKLEELTGDEPQELNRILREINTPESLGFVQRYLSP